MGESLGTEIISCLFNSLVHLCFSLKVALIQTDIPNCGTAFNPQTPWTFGGMGIFGIYVQVCTSSFQICNLNYQPHTSITMATM